MRPTLLPLILLAFSANAAAFHLCDPKEERIFSFETKKKKILSLCKGENASYLVARLGTRAGIDLQYPAQLDNTSWQQFAFEGHRRGGGKANAAFSAHLLTFLHDDAEYAVFQEWDSEDDRYEIGLQVERNGKTLTFRGLKTTQEGSMERLEADEDKLQNMADED